MSDKNIKIFEDTQRYYSEHFQKEIESSIANERVYTDTLEVDLANKKTYKPKITVTKNSTIQASLHIPDSKVLLHNFASATNPGGGVVVGSSAQEESVCRCTTLYPCLNNSEDAWNNFYNFHRSQKDNRYSDRCIYTPGVIVFKDDSGAYLPRTKTVDFITCAAPNLRAIPNNKYNEGSSDVAVKLSDEDLYDIHSARGKQILSVAIENGDTSIVLGAFGCGAFQNKPEIVAYAYNDLLQEYAKYFKNIEFAIYCGRDWTNFEVFDGIVKKS